MNTATPATPALPTNGIEVVELAPMECITEETGTFRLVSFELMRVEEIELPSELETE